MAKPPPTPPSSDITGANQSNVTPADPRRWDAQAQRQLDAENDENTGRPDTGKGSPSEGIPKGGNTGGGAGV